MSNFDEDIKRITNEVLEDGTVDQIIREKIVNGFRGAIDDAFRWGELKNAIDQRVKSVLVPFIEGYDMNEYIVKLDTVLTDIVNHTGLEDNTKILSNFKELMIEPGIKEITLSEMFDKYKEYVAGHVDTSGRNVETDDDEPYYEPMEVFASIVMEDKRSWSSFQYGTLDFKVDEEDQEEKLNFSIKLSKYENSREQGYDMTYDAEMTVHGMRRLNDFEVYILRLVRAGVKLIADTTELEDEVIPTTEPEVTYE